MSAHTLNLRIYYEDTDAGGVVYHANYLRYGERARTELLRDCGFTNRGLREDIGIIFVVRHIEADYYKPAFLEDDLQVRSVIDEIKNTSCVMHHSVYRGDDLIFDMRVTLVCVAADNFKPVRMPDAVKTGFDKFTV